MLFSTGASHVIHQMNPCFRSVPFCYYILLVSWVQMVQTPLHIAASLNRVEIMKYLLDWAGPGKVELEAKNVVCGSNRPLNVSKSDDPVIFILYFCIFLPTAVW